MQPGHAGQLPGRGAEADGNHRRAEPEQLRRRQQVGKVTGSSQFIAQLTAPSGPTHSLTKGTGLEEAEVKGHYLILTWVEFTTHRAPETSAEKKQLKAFSADLISQTANVSLTSRMVTGQPQVP